MSTLLVQCSNYVCKSVAQLQGIKSYVKCQIPLAKVHASFEGATHLLLTFVPTLFLIIEKCSLYFSFFLPEIEVFLFPLFSLYFSKGTFGCNFLQYRS